jgi:hypothetical protein
MKHNIEVPIAEKGVSLKRECVVVEHVEFYARLGNTAPRAIGVSCTRSDAIVRWNGNLAYNV